MVKLYNQKVVAENKISLGSVGSKSFTYKGFDSTNAKSGFKSYDIDIVKQDIINHFYIKKGEKLENPDFGSIIWEVLFEPMTEEVKTLISRNVEEIINYDPRIEVNSIVIDTTEQGIRIEAEITYLPFNVIEKMVFDFDKENGLII